MVYRIFVERKNGFDIEAQALFAEIKGQLGIERIDGVRIINRYDAENISEELFDTAIRTVFSEPQTDNALSDIELGDASVFAVEYLPGQFDQRADSAAQCIQIISRGDRPLVRSAKIYALYGKITAEELETIKKYIINPVEAREASLEKPSTLKTDYVQPQKVKILEGFRRLSDDELREFVASYGLAMDMGDLKFCKEYFESEGRDPSLAEIRMIDTYWSDHCRHTTFLTNIDSVKFEYSQLEETYKQYLDVRNELGRNNKPICLMDIATIAAKYLKAQGKLDKLDESEEINACTVKIDVEAEGRVEKWLLLFKNETHNHPTEIEPFGGAATCIGGAIRDPLSGRSYVYGAMRVTGAADPTVPLSETILGKLSQRKLVTTAAAGYSSYGNQIGLATGIVDELYHPGYVAKRLEIGAVIAAAPEENVRRETPIPGDVIILLGGATGRDGIGGATGSSKAHTSKSVETCGAEVQKGNAPEERKLQRLIRNKEACRMIKRCNDFGAGGVSVAIGELADGLDIDLDKVPRKYEGLDGTELAISESQERMAVVVAKEDADRFISIANSENLSAVAVAVVKEEKRLTMNWNGDTIIDISRDFLNSNGAEKHINIDPAMPHITKDEISGNFAQNMLRTASDLNTCSKRGLAERFDSTIGAGTVIMPFGGSRQITPAQAMVQKISIEKYDTDTCSLMAYGFDPYLSEMSPYHGAYCAVVESVSKLIASGAKFEDVYLTFQEYFEKPGSDPKRWGKPFAALLGAFKAQMDLGIAAIGGKDSMSGSFEKIDVPPTLVSFAVTTSKVEDIVSNEFKKAGHLAVMLCSDIKDGLPEEGSIRSLFGKVNALLSEKKAYACYVPCMGGAAEAVMKMAFGNGYGFRFNDCLDNDTLFGKCGGRFIIETDSPVDGGITLGTVTDDGMFSLGNNSISADELLNAYEGRLEDIFKCNIPSSGKCRNIDHNAKERFTANVKCAKPRVLIPVFPGTNCEYDSAKAVELAGAQAELFVINNLTQSGIARSVDEFAKKLSGSQMIFIPGGFSGGDEPDGSGKFITSFFRNSAIREEVTRLLNDRDGLILGICNGFQALVKLGLVPFGKIVDVDEECPTLTYNTIGRHQSRIVRTRVASDKSPWLSRMHTGNIVNVPISHGEGRFVASEKMLEQLIANGQIATQYADETGNASMDIHYNPNGSICAIEGITSPDGRVFGKMGHSERIGKGLYKNVPGSYDMHLFDAAVDYFRK